MPMSGKNDIIIKYRDVTNNSQICSYIINTVRVIYSISYNILR